MSRIKIDENIHIKFNQLLGVTADNASNNDKMIERLAELIDNFPGTANQTRCFTHILNLVAKSVLRQFEAPKAKGIDSINDAMKELVAVSDELEDEGDDVAVDEEGEEDGDDEGDDDDDDGLQEEREGMSQEQLAELEASVQPIRLVLTKV
jgi:Ran GTPase-activating protein (RanGAP) involved in mRNA processing and transport